MLEPIAQGGDLSINTLLHAYRHGIFPWFSAGEPIYWWSPDPRMVLQPSAFRLHRSLRKQIQQLLRAERLELRIDHDFARVIAACADTPRNGQNGTWILPQMQAAYCALQQHGYAHSLETWIDGQLQGGLYCVAIGQAVFGESMFSWCSNASKIALAALVALCVREGAALIDCQQATAHLHSLGARLIARAQFLAHVLAAREAAPMRWQFCASRQAPYGDWQSVLSLRS